MAEQPQNNRGNLSLRRRGLARLAAVQSLYQLQLNDGMEFDVDRLVANYKAQHAHGKHLGDDAMGDLEPDYRYLTTMLAGLRESRPLLAPVLTKLLEKAWNKDRLPPVMQAIFEAALYELSAGRLKPRQVLDEYVRLAARFFDEKETSFVNGVLHDAAEQLGHLPASE